MTLLGKTEKKDQSKSKSQSFKQKTHPKKEHTQVYATSRFGISQIFSWNRHFYLLGQGKLENPPQVGLEGFKHISGIHQI